MCSSLDLLDLGEYLVGEESHALEDAFTREMHRHLDHEFLSNKVFLNRWIPSTTSFGVPYMSDKAEALRLDFGTPAAAWASLRHFSIAAAAQPPISWGPHE